MAPYAQQQHGKLVDKKNWLMEDLVIVGVTSGASSQDKKTKDGCRWYCYGWIGSLHPVIVPREEKESEVPCTIYIFCSS